MHNTLKLTQFSNKAVMLMSIYCLFMLSASGQTPTPNTTSTPQPTLDIVGGRTPPISVATIADSNTQLPASKCINRNTDTLLLKVLNVILDKNSGLFKKDEAAGLHFKVNFQGEVMSNTVSNTQAISYDNVSTVRVEDFSNGQVILPITRDVIHLIPLKSKDNKSIVTGVHLEMILLKKKGNTNFGFVVQNLAQFAENFPLPSDPLGQGVKAISNLTANLLKEENDKANNIDKRAPAAVFDLTFGDSETCSPSIAHTGLYAIITQAKDINKPGYVDIGNRAQYCFGATSAGSGLLFAKKPAGNGTCTPNQNVLNSHVLYTLETLTSQAVKDNPQSAPSPQPSASPQTRESRTPTVPPVNPPHTLVGPLNRSTVSIAASTLPLSERIKAYLDLYPWYALLSTDFKSKVNAEAAYVERITQGGTQPQVSSTGDPDNVLAADYVRLVQSCIALKIEPTSCSLPMPPERLAQR